MSGEGKEGRQGDVAHPQKWVSLHCGTCLARLSSSLSSSTNFMATQVSNKTSGPQTSSQHMSNPVPCK